MKIKQLELRNIIKESLRSIISESAQGLKSKKLYDILKQYGGFSPNDINHGVIDLHNTVDADVIGVLPNSEVYDIQDKGRKYDHLRWVDNFGLKDWAREKGYDLRPQDDVDACQLADGKNSVIIICRNARFDSTSTGAKDQGGWRKTWNLRSQRKKNGNPWNDGKNQYQWNNKEAYDAWNNPYLRSHTLDPEIEKWFMDKARETWRNRHPNASLNEAQLRMIIRKSLKEANDIDDFDHFDPEKDMSPEEYNEYMSQQQADADKTDDEMAKEMWDAYLSNQEGEEPYDPSDNELYHYM